MIIELASVGKTPRAINATFGPDAIELDDEGKLEGDAELSGSLVSDERGVHLAGHISANIALECVRCLEPVVTAIDVDFEDVFVDAERESQAAEAEVTDDALDESLVIDGKLDLADVVREQIILELPEQPLCREDCKGLCPKCGGNRNLIDCKCEDNEIDPRWAGLMNLN